VPKLSKGKFYPLDTSFKAVNEVEYKWARRLIKFYVAMGKMEQTKYLEPHLSSAFKPLVHYYNKQSVSFLLKALENR